MFDPEAWASSPEMQSRITKFLDQDDLQGALTTAFSLPGPPDPHVYRAIAAVTLPQAQRALSLGRANGLHRWYLKAPADSSTSTSTSSLSLPSSSSSSSPSSNAVVPPTEENDLGNPPVEDIVAYTDIFQPPSAPGKALASLTSNAKRASLRGQVGAYLTSKRILDIASLGGQTPSRPPKKKAEQQQQQQQANGAKTVTGIDAASNAYFNPALDFWTWSCRALEWGGPCEAATRSHIAHPILPLFMHHFGCVAPSYEACEVIRLVVQRRRRWCVDKARREREGEQRSEGKEDEISKPDNASEAKSFLSGLENGAVDEPITEVTKKKKKKKKKGGSSISKSSMEDAVPSPRIIDLGSGNGYWTYILRRHHNLPVVAIDNQQSLFRTSWISDTIHEDGARWLRQNKGAEHDVLLLVYPVVGADFTRTMIHEFRGRDIIVAGTQNRNGYTAFKDMTIDEWFAGKGDQSERNGGGAWKMTARIALPSFAGKDEALYVFSRDLD